jgi:hypothetical protein
MVPETWLTNAQQFCFFPGYIVEIIGLKKFVYTYRFQKE